MIPENAGATVCLDVADLAEVLNQVGVDGFTDQLIQALSTNITDLDQQQVQGLARTGFNYSSPSVGLVEWMPSMTAGEMVSIKTVGYHPDNPVAKNLPSVLATTSLYDTATGQLAAICEGTLLTALRTGAASAVMTDALVRPGPIALGVVGCGAQAVTQIHAISRVRPIVRLLVTDIEPANAASLAGRLPAGTLSAADGRDIPVEQLGILAFNEAIGDLDVLCTCTSVDIDKGPVIDIHDAGPGLHVNAVGSDFPGKIEIPVDYLRSAVVVPDVIEQCLLEGESQQLQVTDLGPDMVQVLSDPANRELVNQRTVFDSTGWAYEDQLAAMLFLEHATRLNIGTMVQLQNAPEDPYDPFELLRG